VNWQSVNPFVQHLLNQCLRGREGWQVMWQTFTSDKLCEVFTVSIANRGASILSPGFLSVKDQQALHVHPPPFCRASCYHISSKDQLLWQYQSRLLHKLR
jgi:hypothetical protein